MYPTLAHSNTPHCNTCFSSTGTHSQTWHPNFLQSCFWTHLYFQVFSSQENLKFFQTLVMQQLGHQVIIQKNHGNIFIRLVVNILLLVANKLITCFSFKTGCRFVPRQEPFEEGEVYILNVKFGYSQNICTLQDVQYAKSGHSLVGKT